MKSLKFFALILFKHCLSQHLCQILEQVKPLPFLPGIHDKMWIFRYNSVDHLKFDLETECVFNMVEFYLGGFLTIFDDGPLAIPKHSFQTSPIQRYQILLIFDNFSWSDQKMRQIGFLMVFQKVLAILIIF